jgi:hypothetical protein
MRNLAVILILILLTAVNTSAQYYDTGQDPARLKWLQIKTDRFRIIYPESFTTEAADYAYGLEKAYKSVSALFPGRIPKMPVIIHNYTTQANGYVAWAPKRMELYPSPEQNTIPLDQKTQLLIHEMTHVFQMEALNSGFSRAMSFIAGEQFPGALASMLPLWYLEGDAVFAESYLTGSGRGRAPSFHKELKALVTGLDKPYNYNKILNGSFKDNVPDHYQIGYQMVAWSYAGYDRSIWNRALDFTAKQPFTLNPVNLSLRKSAGLTKKILYEQTFDTLKALWQKDLSNNLAREYDERNPDKKRSFVNYYSPQLAGKDSIIAIKTSLYDPPQFVIIDPVSRTERRIFTPGPLYPWTISYAAGSLVWVERRYDPRWENRNYSVIRLLNVKTGIVRQLTFGTRFMAAGLSPDGRVIAAVENSVNNRDALVFINAYDGSEMVRANAPEKTSLQRPQWSSDGTFVTVISLTEHGEGILGFRLADKSWTSLKEERNEDIQASFIRNDTLFYASSVSGTENLYFLTPGGETKGFTRSRFGATDPFFSGNSVWFSNYTMTGNQLSRADLGESFDYKGEEHKESFLIDRIPPGASEPPSGEMPEYISRPYRKWQHLAGLHSWMPFYADLEAIQADPASVRPGFTLLSQNHLSTLITSAGYEYSADGRHLLHSRIEWKGWYPVFESRIDYGYRPEIDSLGRDVSALHPVISNGFRSYTSIYLPLSATTGKFTHSLFPSFSVDYRNRYSYIPETRAFDHGQTTFSTRLYFSNSHRMAIRDIYPRWAQVFDLSYSWAPFDKYLNGTDLSLRTAFYVPGLLKNNGIRLRFEKEKQTFARFLSTNRNRYPRGYKNIISEKLTYLSFDYISPLAYPDLSIGSLFYLTRLRAGVFYDYARGFNNYFLAIRDGSLAVNSRTPGVAVFSSFGLELNSDFYLLRIPFPLTAGIQAAWKGQGESPVLEFLFNIDIYGMNIGSRKASWSRGKFPGAFFNK